MLTHRFKEKVKSKKVKVKRRSIRRISFYLLPFTFLLATGCRMDMQDQPKVEVYEKDAIRQPVEGTVARGQLKEDKQLYTGKKDQAGASGTTANAQPNQSAPQTPGAGNANVPPGVLYPDAVETFPFPVTEEIVKRGKERYEIFCSMCHGATGYGDGMIVRRGYRRPPSYHTDQLRQAPAGHFFDVVTNGWGSMPRYDAMIPVTDRWAIVAYIRALQLSQNPQGTPSATATPQNQTSQPQSAETGGRR